MGGDSSFFRLDSTKECEIGEKLSGEEGDGGNDINMSYTAGHSPQQVLRSTTKRVGQQLPFNASSKSRSMDRSHKGAEQF